MPNLNNDGLRKEGNSGLEFKKGLPDFDHDLERVTRESGKKIGEFASNAADSAMKQARSGRDYIARNPITGVAIATASGLVAGSLLTMVMRRRHH
jgi:ElaB/YqjD/DUF883 family membrane-anchored ribosome-binding protein